MSHAGKSPFDRALAVPTREQTALDADDGRGDRRGGRRNNGAGDIDTPLRLRDRRQRFCRRFERHAPRPGNCLRRQSEVEQSGLQSSQRRERRLSVAVSLDSARQRQRHHSAMVQLHGFRLLHGGLHIYEPWKRLCESAEQSAQCEQRPVFDARDLESAAGGSAWRPEHGRLRVSQALSGYQGSLTPPPGGETFAFETTPGLGAGGGGYLDNGVPYMATTVIDGTAGTISYYVYRLSDGAGGLQQTVPATPLSSYSFTNAYLGRSAFLGDNWTSGAVDEFRIFSEARSAGQIAADFRAGPNVIVPEPAALTLVACAMGLLLAARRRG